MGEFKSDALNLSILGVNNKQAVKLMDRAGWQQLESPPVRWVFNRPNGLLFTTIIAALMACHFGGCRFVIRACPTRGLTI